MMKNLLLLILILIAGCRVSSDTLTVEGCNKGWVDFNCSYPKTNQRYRAVELKFNENTVRRDTADKWVAEGRFSFYHNTTSKIFRVIIKPIGDKFGEYKCNFFPKQQTDKDEDQVEVKVKVKKALPSLCQDELAQTVSRREKTIITCKYHDQYKSFNKFLCREKTGEKKNFICEDILSTESPLQSNGEYTLIKTKNGFNVSISDVSSEHQGIYWCGVKFEDEDEDEDEHGSYRAGVKKTHLIVGDSPMPSVTPSSSTTRTNATDPSKGDPLSPIILPVVSCVVVLVLLLVVIFVYSRFKHSKNRRNGEQTEERAYEEIQERPQQPDSGTALKSIYATANLPTMPSAPPHSSNITLKSSACKEDEATYSSVKDQSPAYSTVNHPDRCPDDPFYSTLSHPQQQ